MASPKNKLKQRVTELPTSPGVYLMKGAAAKIIYIGKAVNLKSRVSGYFNKSNTYRISASCFNALEFSIGVAFVCKSPNWGKVVRSPKNVKLLFCKA